MLQKSYRHDKNQRKNYFISNFSTKHWKCFFLLFFFSFSLRDIGANFTLFNVALELFFSELNYWSCKNQIKKFLNSPLMQQLMSLTCLAEINIWKYTNKKLCY